MAVDVEFSPANNQQAYPVRFAWGRKQDDKHWEPTETTWDQLPNELSRLKDTLATQGTLVGVARTRKSVSTCHVLAFVVENGLSFDVIVNRCRDLRNAALVYRLPDRGSTQTLIDEAAFWRFCRKNGFDAPSDDVVRKYLLDELGFLSDVAETAKHGRKELLPGGMIVIAEHAPIDRFVIIELLPEPFDFTDIKHGSQSDAISRWSTLKAAAAKQLGLYVDRATLDPAFCFPCPNGADVVRVCGLPVDTGALEIEPAAPSTSVHVSAEGFKTPGLKRFLAKCAADFEAADWMRDRDPDGLRHDHGDRLDFECPNEDGHSDPKPDDRAFMVINASDRDGGGFHMGCLHNGCQEASGKDRAWYLDMACQKYGVKDASELLDWCPNAGKSDTAGNASSTPDRKAHEGGEGWIKRMIVPPETLTVLEAMNEQHAFIVYGGRTRFLCDTQNPQEHELPYQFVDEQTFKNLYEDQPDVKLIKRKLRNGGDPNDPNAWEDEPVWKPRAWTWNNWPGRRKYTRIGFYPNQEPPSGAFNFWEGWRHTPKRGSWKWTLRHLYEVVCARDPDKFRYLIDHLSHLIQTTGRPSERSPVSLFVWGEHGSGKSIVFDHIAKLFGNHGITLSKSEELTGTFNKHLMTGCFAVCEEAVYGHDQKAAATLKDILTRRTMNIHPKNVDMFTAPNFLRFTFIGNHQDNIPMTEGERRYEVFHVSSHRIDDQVWFDRIIREMDTGGLEAMFYDLQTRSYDKNSVRRLMKRNTDRDIAKARALAPPIRFALEWIAHGAVMIPNNEVLPGSCSDPAHDKMGAKAPHRLSEISCGGGDGVLRLNRDGKSRVISADVAKAYKAWCGYRLDVYEQKKCQRADNRLIREIREGLPFIKKYRSNTERGIELPPLRECADGAALNPIHAAYLGELDD